MSRTDVLVDADWAKARLPAPTVVFGAGVRDVIGTKNLVDVRGPDEVTGKIAAPAHLPQEAGARFRHTPPPSTWLRARPPTTTAPPTATTTCARSTPTPAWTRARRPSPAPRTAKSYGRAQVRAFVGAP